METKEVQESYREGERMARPRSRRIAMQLDVSTSHSFESGQFYPFWVGARRGYMLGTLVALPFWLAAVVWFVVL